MNPLYLHPHKHGVVLAVRVNPKSSKSKIAGIIGEELKITLNAPPVDGKANKELTKLLSKTFSIPKSNITLLSGETSRSKRLLLNGLDAQDVIDILGMILKK